MARKKRKNRRGRGILTLLVILLALGGGALLFQFHFVLVDGHIYRRNAAVDISDVQTGWDPDADVVWSVTIGGESYDVQAESIAVGDFGLDELDKFALFTRLKTVDGSASHSYEALMALRERRPKLSVHWRVPLSGTESCPDDAAEAAVTGQTSAAYLESMLPWLPQLEQLDLYGASFADGGELAELVAAFPQIRFLYRLQLLGQTVDSADTALRFPGLNAGQLEELAAQSALLPEVTDIDLGGGLYDAQAVAALRAAYRGARIHCRLSFYGVETDALAEELDLSGIPISDTSGVDAAVACMAELKKIVMSDCGIPDEEMDALNRKFDDVRVVWTVYVKEFPCRTDSDNFIVRVPDHNGKITNEQVAPLQYCPDMVTLDLGHMEIDDIFFIENMPHLRFLIIGDTRVADLSPLQNCYELYYLEMFICQATDLSPLLDKTSLKHLNVSRTRSDVSQICQMTWLERLWWMDPWLSGAEIEQIQEALPDTKICFFDADTSSVNRGWRDDDSYREMRDNLDMPYHL